MSASAATALTAIAQALDTAAPLDLTAPGSQHPEQAASYLGALVASLGLPTRLQHVGIDRDALPAIAASVAEAYPQALEQLGGNGRARLDELLVEMW